MFTSSHMFLDTTNSTSLSLSYRENGTASEGPEAKLSAARNRFLSVPSVQRSSCTAEVPAIPQADGRETPASSTYQ